MKTTQEILQNAKAAASELALLSPAAKNAALLKMADYLEKNAAEILAANAEDVEAAKATLGDVMIDRLRKYKFRKTTWHGGFECLFPYRNLL